MNKKSFAAWKYLCGILFVLFLRWQSRDWLGLTWQAINGKLLN